MKLLLSRKLVQPSYGHKGQPPSHCFGCKDTGMVNVKSKIFLYVSDPDSHMVHMDPDPYVPYVNEGHFGWPLCPYDGIYNVSHPEVGMRRRLRTEIRDLTSGEWDRVVHALWIMKQTPTKLGRQKYGSLYFSYDRLILKHVRAALYSKGDQAHFTVIFPIFHRLWLLQFENALLSVDPEIQGLPYFDFKREEGPYASAFSDQYLGDISGDPNNFYIVTNGPFAYWPVSKIKEIRENTWKFPGNTYGYLRHPLSLNKSPFLTRNGHNMCSSYVGLGDSSAWNSCLALENMMDYCKCIDPTLHSPLHSGVGGSWQVQSTSSSTTSCAQWYGYISPPNAETLIPQEIGSFINPYSAGCFTCPTPCDSSERENLDINECMCTPNSPRCGPLWSGLLRKNNSLYQVELTSPNNIECLGDFTDPVASPNDIIFALHHANIDRHFDEWLRIQRVQGRQANYFNYPTTGAYAGCLLDSVVNQQDPFYGHIMNSSSVDKSQLLTVRNVFDMIPPDSIYSYQSSTNSEYSINKYLVESELVVYSSGSALRGSVVTCSSDIVILTLIGILAFIVGIRCVAHHVIICNASSSRPPPISSDTNHVHTADTTDTS